VKSFIQYLNEQRHGSLHVVDVDDTLFHTTARVRVRNAAGKIIRYLTNQEFNDYKLKPGERYDYKEFKSARKFSRESKPIHKVIDKINKIQSNLKKKKNSRVIINTARADFDNKREFLNTFRKQGMDIDKIHVHRAGNIPGDELPALKKVKIIKQYLDKNSHKKVIMYDDSRTNLKALLNMKKEYPDVTFIAMHVGPDGTLTRIKDGD